MGLIRSLVVTATLVIMAAAEYDDDFCKKRLGQVDDSNAQGLKPVFYDNFYVFMEMKSFLNQTVMYIDEYYSEQAGMVYGTLRGPVNQTQIWVDATTNEVMTGPTSSSVCVDTPLLGSPVAQYVGATTDAKGDVTLNTPEVALGWHKKYQKEIKFLGDAVVPGRGINSVKWQVCSFSPDTQITSVTNWYIVDPSKTTLPVVNNASKPVLPVLAEVEAINKTDPLNIQEFSVRVDFTFYDRIQANSPVFQIPTTMMCAAKPSAQVPLPQAPSYFKFRGEEITINNQNSQNPDPANFVYTVETYMPGMNMFIQDYISTPGIPVRGNDKSYQRVVNDYSTGLSFAMDLMSGACSANVIPPNGVDSVSIAGGFVKMRNSQQFFDLDSKSYQYMGIHTKRSIDCDAWSAYFTDGNTNHIQNALYTWYFANPQWLKNNGFSNWTNPLPVSLEIQQATSYIQFNIYEFDTLDGMQTPDVSLCFDPSYTLNIEFFISASFDTILDDASFESFRRAVYAALIEQTSLLSLLRISKMDLQPSSNSETVVRFQLFDLHSLHITGDVPAAKLGVPNQQIFSELTKAINAGTFSIVINVQTDTEMLNTTFYARKNSVGLYTDGKFQAGSASTGSSSSSSSTGYSPGSMAGIGIGMLVLGLIVGVAVIFGVKKYRARSGDNNMDLKKLDHEPET